MANILLTNICNRACSFCFAAEEVELATEKISRSKEEWAMGMGEVNKIIEFHKLSNLKQMAILGGEPTIHPKFNSIINLVLEAGLGIKLFTGGLIPKRVKDHLSNVDSSCLNIIINLSALEDCRSAKEYQRIINTVHELAPYSTLSYTISTPDFDGNFLVDLIVESGCRPHIRLGLELPMLSDVTPRLEPMMYRETAKRIMELAEYGHRNNAFLGFDCGFVMCMFTPEELGYLRAWNSQANFVCRPIIDISPNLEIWSCFATAPLHRTRLDSFETRQELEKYFQEQQKPYRTFGVFEDCSTCLYKTRGQCAGGCLSYVIKDFIGSGFNNQTGITANKNRNAPDTKKHLSGVKIYKRNPYND